MKNGGRPKPKLRHSSSSQKTFIGKRPQSGAESLVMDRSFEENISPPFREHAAAAVPSEQSSIWKRASVICVWSWRGSGVDHRTLETTASVLALRSSMTLVLKRFHHSAAFFQGIDDEPDSQMPFLRIILASERLFFVSHNGIGRTCRGISSRIGNVVLSGETKMNCPMAIRTLSLVTASC